MFPQRSLACPHWQQERGKMPVLQAIREALWQTRTADPLLTMVLADTAGQWRSRFACKLAL